MEDEIELNLPGPSLETLISELNHSIEDKLKDFNPTEISNIYSSIPRIKSTVEYSEEREIFLKQFNSPGKIPKLSIYSEELLESSSKKIDLPNETSNDLKLFFQNEIKRVTNINDIVMSRLSNSDIVYENSLQYSLFSKSIADRLFQCQESLLRLSSTTMTTFNYKDVDVELKTHYSMRLKKAYIESFKNYVINIPISFRQQILPKILKSITDLMTKDTTMPTVPLYHSTEQQVDEELKKISQIFSITVDVDASDGQEYLYHADRKFNEYWKKLEIKYPTIESKVNLENIKPTFESLVCNAVVQQVTLDVNVSFILESLISFREDEVLSKVRENVRFHNNNNIPEHKLLSWIELRYVYMKFLLLAIQSIMNFFIMILSREDYVVRQNSIFPQIIEIYKPGRKEPFHFSQTQTMYVKVRDSLVKAASYYIQKVEQSGIEPTPDVDREALVLKLLEYEFRYLTAKRSLVQSLLEAYSHSKSEILYSVISSVINSTEQITLQLYHSFETPFLVTIEAMEKRAKLMRYLINTQILHERQVGSRLMQHIPIFDRPSTIPDAKLCIRPYVESSAINIFEVYDTLSEVHDILHLLRTVAKEFCETLEIKSTRFLEVVETTLMDFVDDSFSKIDIAFPYDKFAKGFSLVFSDTAGSLFSSPYIDDPFSVDLLMEQMNEARKMRFYISYRKFLHLAWILQDELVRTSHLQKAYLQTCDWLEIGERVLVFPPFKATINDDAAEVQTGVGSEKTVELAISEFETVSLDFSSQVDVKDIIASQNFDLLKRIVRFQRLQNSLLEVAVRYNSVIIDSDTIIRFFEIDDSKEEIFLTVSEDVENQISESQISESQAKKFAKQLIASQMFYSSLALYRDNQSANSSKQHFVCDISSLKAKTRTDLQDQSKTRDYNTEDLEELYRSEMVDLFAPYMYRFELSVITKLERHMLMRNSFVDTFVLGPVQNHELVNESGRFENFFYVPSWVECLCMMQTSPSAKSALVLKSVLECINYRLLLFEITRFECSLEQNKEEIFSTLNSFAFQMETAVFQKLSAELDGIPNIKEPEVLSRFLSEKYTFFFYRMELMFLYTIDHFYACHRSDSNTGNLILVGSTDRRFDASVKDLWTRIHADSLKYHGILYGERYAPQWMGLFLHSISDSDRVEFKNSLDNVDSVLEERIQETKRENVFFEDSQLLPTSIDFLSSFITQLHLKYVYFLLINNTNYKEINHETSITKMSSMAFTSGINLWNSSIIKNAMRSVAPKDESTLKYVQISKYGHMQAVFDIVRNEIDSAILATQINELQSLTENVDHALQRTLENNINRMRPTYDTNLVPDKFSGSAVINPFDADSQQNEELCYSIARLVNTVFHALDSTTLERRDHDNTYSTLYDADAFEKNLLEVSHKLQTFSDDSKKTANKTWTRYMTGACDKFKSNMEYNAMSDEIERLMRCRFNCQVENGSVILYGKQYLTTNQLRDELEQLRLSMIHSETLISNEIKEEMEQLVGDLNGQIVERKKKFAVVKSNMLNNVTDKIKQATTLQMEVDPSFNFDPSSIDKKDLIVQRKDEISEMKRTIVKMRMIRCLSNISVSRIFTKKITVAENNRKQANTTFWSSKFIYDTTEDTVGKLLREAQSRFASLDAEMEQLRLLVENEKMSNIQLIHWKTKNKRRIDELMEQISKFGDNFDVDVGDLIGKIEASSQELAELCGETDEVERQIEQYIRKPMNELTKMKQEMKHTRIQQGEAISKELAASRDIDEEAIRRNEHISALIADNKRLQAENEFLKEQIEKQMNEKAARATDQIHFMETASQTKSSLSKAFARHNIVKPLIKTRSISRV